MGIWQHFFTLDLREIHAIPAFFPGETLAKQGNPDNDDH
jgi:hypothetical protein